MEKRIKSKIRYYEKHHIIPDFMFKDRKRKGPKGHLSGDPNDKANIILLTPREHFIAHALLYKIYKGSRYEHSAGSALIFFTSKVIEKTKHPRYKITNTFKSSIYEFYRKIGLKSISNARKGTMPAVDAKTRISVGSVSTTHPKVLSGEWIHHSKGIKKTKEQIKNYPTIAGDKNPNFKKLTVEMEKSFIDTLYKISDIDNVIKSKDFYNSYNSSVSCKRLKISDQFIRNKFSSFSKFIDTINAKYKTNFVYLGNNYKRK